MAAGNHRGYLRGERVRLKKYFYVLRPLLAVRWIEAFGTPPPMAFESLVDALALPAPLLAAVHELLQRKRATPELGEGPPVPAIQAFIEAELARPLQGAAPSEPWPAAEGDAGPVRAVDSAVTGIDRWAALDALFGRVLFEDTSAHPRQGLPV
ncbi:MAG: nucleotidyltransferase domain-containing protein [Rubrivivax sp.]|nr:nucleotidyltransferase domain-containing protein [Rubrivivax sp.]